MNQTSSKGELELIKTYNVGLRYPESLLSGFRDLMRRQQLLRFLLRLHSARFSSKQLKSFEELALTYSDPKLLAFEKLKSFNSLQQANETVVSSYASIFDDYFNFTDAQLLKELDRVNELIAGHKTQNRQLNSAAFSRSAVPTFKDLANPQPNEISLHDYEATANKSLKLMCSHINTFAMKNIDKLPETRDELIQIALNITKISKSQSKDHPYKAASAYLGSGRNIDQIAMEQMTGMMEVYQNTRSKVNYVSSLLYPEQEDTTDFSEVLPVLMTYYSLPRYFLWYVSKAWNVGLGWVRNTLVGWRRKVDTHLPVKFQVESLTALMKNLADHCKAHVSGEDALQVINHLQKRHILHLLHDPSIDLSLLLPKRLWRTYQTLKRKFKGWTPALQQEIDKHCTDISKEVFAQAGEQLCQSVEDTMKSLDPESIGYKTSRTFLKKLRLILANADHFRAVFQHYLPVA